MKTALPKSAAGVDAFRETILHELSQPVTALQGSLEVALLRGQTGRELKKAIEAALEQSNRLATLLAVLRDHPPRPNLRPPLPAKSKTR